MKISIMAMATFAVFNSLPSAASEEQQVTSKYFRHIVFRETPFSQYRGIYPINQQTAKNSAHYKFDYDKQGRVVSVSYQLGDKLINQNGVWDSFIWFAPKVTIRYSTDGEEHHYYNVNNERSEVHGQVYTAKYTYDKRGQRQSLRFYDKQGKPSENAWQAHHYAWQIDAQNRIQENRYNLSKEQVTIRPNFDFYELRLDYGNDDLLDFMYNYGKNSELTDNNTGVAMDRIYYDKNGNFQRWQVFNSKREPVEGNRPQVHTGEHLYDEFGNKVGLRGYDRFGQRMRFSWGDFEVSNSYNQHGNQITAQTLDEQGQIEMNVIVEYDPSQTKRTMLKFVDEQGQLTANKRFNGAAAISYKYKDGSRIPFKQVALNSNLKPIK